VTGVFWDGNTDGDGDGVNWLDRFNWSRDALPTGSDDVTIGSGFGTILIGASGAAARSLIANSGIQISGAGTLDLASASQFSDVFSLAGGSLLGTGSASVTGPGGALAWSGGTMGAGGAFQLVANRSGTLTNSLVLNRTFQNEGLLTLAGATLSGSGAIANAGTITAASGTTNSIANTFHNIVDTVAGTLLVNGALAMTTLVHTGGMTTINGSLSVATLDLAAGTVDGTGDLAVTGNFAAGGGTLGTTFSDLSLRTTGDFAVGGFTAVDSINLRAGGAITLNGAVTTTTGGGDSIVIAGTSFTNNAGAGALDPGAGRFLVWSGDPANDSRGGLAYAFKQYGASYGVSAVLGSGNGFLYAATPSVTPILAGTVSKTYDATTAANLAGSNYSVLGAIDGDTVTLNNPAAGVYADKNAGIGKSVSVNGISMTGASNGAATVYGYQLASASASGNVGEITPAPLTVTADNASKTYGQVTTFSGSEFTSSGLQGGETLGSVMLASAGAAATAGVAGSPYAIVASDAAGGTFSAGNYTITYNNGSLTIAPAALAVTADNKTREYGLANPTLTGTLTGLVNGDTAAVVSGLAYATTATTASDVGSFAIASSGGTAANYVITARNDGTLTITPAPLAITANDATKSYGQVVNFNGSEFSASGLRNGNTIGSVTLASAGVAPTASVNGGPYAITPSNAAGGSFDAANYTITYVNGQLSVLPATLTYVADPTSRFQGDPNPSFTGQVTGFVNDESLATATSGTLLWTSTADATSLPGGYAIDGGGLAALGGNYLFTQSASNLVALTVSVPVAISPALINPPPPPPPPTYGAQGANVPLADGTLLNVSTGQTLQAPSNALPDPGIYLNQGGGSVMVVGQSTAATQLVFPANGAEPGTYVNSENGMLYIVEENTPLDPGVYYNRDAQTVLVVSSGSDGNVTVASANVKETVQAVASGAGGRRVASVVCR
jgi:hypothetical protein